MADLTVETAELGHVFTALELQEQCRAIVGGVAWPGKCEGFALILSVTGERKGPYGVYLLAEVESPDLAELIRQCDVLDGRYVPHWWVGDGQKPVAAKIMGEVVRAKVPVGVDSELVRGFRSLRRNFLLDDDGLYEYAIPMLKSLLLPEGRQLWLKGSRVCDYMSQIKAEELPFLRRGDYPAIEALIYAVREALDWIAIDRRPSQRVNALQERIRHDPMAF